MNRHGIILPIAALVTLFFPVLSADGQVATQRESNLFPPPAAGSDASAPIYIQPQGPMIGPAGPLEIVPLVPVPAYSSPRPAPLQGPIFAPPTGATGSASANSRGTLAQPVVPGAAAPSKASAPFGSIAPDGSISPQFGLPRGPQTPSGPANPILVPVSSDLVAWEQITDVVSSYFTISREQQARRSGEAWAEGRIDTAYQGGATWFEPHRHDSVGAFNRWESTFQTIRRIASVRVIPDQAGYLVEVIVQKEVEDMPRPEHARAGAAVLRNDNSLPSSRAGVVSRTRSSPRWIPLGRDAALEARMLADIHARLAGATTASRPNLFGTQ